jgi:hypothetical protein
LLEEVNRTREIADKVLPKAGAQPG